MPSLPPEFLSQWFSRVRWLGLGLLVSAFPHLRADLKEEMRELKEEMRELKTLLIQALHLSPAPRP